MAPTYPKERLVESVQELCRTEYGLEAKAAQAGNTFGVLVDIPGILMDLSMMSGSGSQPAPFLIQEDFSDDQLHLQFFSYRPFVKAPKERPYVRQADESEHLKRLRHVFEAIHRVVLSSDSDVEFLVAIVRDSAVSRDLIYITYALDTKLYFAQQFSYTEYGSRRWVDVRVIPEETARQTVGDFLADLRDRRPVTELLRDYVGDIRRFQQLSARILAASEDLGLQAGDLLEGEGTWPVLQTGSDEVQVFVPTEPEGAVLFTVNRLGQERVLTQGAVGALADIRWLPDGTLPEGLRTVWGPAEQWSGKFYLEPVSLKQFLAAQIKDRALSAFEPFPEAEPEPVSKKGTQSKPDAVPPEGKVGWQFWKRPAAPPVEAGEQDVAQFFAETTAKVADIYQVEIPGGLWLFDLKTQTTWQVPGEKLPLYLNRPAPEVQPLR